MSKVVKFTETESKMVVTRGWRVRGGSRHCLTGTVSVL